MTREEKAKKWCDEMIDLAIFTSGLYYIIEAMCEVTRGICKNALETRQMLQSGEINTEAIINMQNATLVNAKEMLRELNRILGEIDERFFQEMEEPKQ